MDIETAFRSSDTPSLCRRRSRPSDDDEERWHRLAHDNDAEVTSGREVQLPHPPALPTVPRTPSTLEALTAEAMFEPPILGDEGTASFGAAAGACACSGFGPHEPWCARLRGEAQRRKQQEGERTARKARRPFFARREHDAREKHVQFAAHEPQPAFAPALKRTLCTTWRMRDLILASACFALGAFAGAVALASLEHYAP